MPGLLCCVTGSVSQHCAGDQQVGEGRVEEGADTCRFVVRNSDVCQSEKQVTYSQTFSNKTKPAHLLRLALAIFYRFLDRHEQIRIVIFRTVHARTDGPSSHGSAREGDQHFFPSLIG
jgi:hypothetical protein